MFFFFILSNICFLLILILILIFFFYSQHYNSKALDEAIRTADLHEASLIIANDPDADRLAAAEFVSSKFHDKLNFFLSNLPCSY